MPALKLHTNPEPRILRPYERAVTAIKAKQIDIVYAPKKEALPLFTRANLTGTARPGDKALAEHLLARERLFRAVLARTPNQEQIRGILFMGTREQKPVGALGEDAFPILYPALMRQGENKWKLVSIEHQHLLHLCVFA